jgi:hypothetical protein
MFGRIPAKKTSLRESFMERKAAAVAALITVSGAEPNRRYRDGAQRANNNLIN